MVGDLGLPNPTSFTLLPRHAGELPQAHISVIPVEVVEARAAASGMGADYRHSDIPN
jgi:hypothetical protein